MIQINVRELSKGLEKFKKTTTDAVREVIADYTHDFIYSLANATPVGNTAPYPEGWLHLYKIRNRFTGLAIKEGYAMGNWRVTFRPTGSAVARYETDPEQVALTAFTRIADDYKLGAPIYIVNNAPYIDKLNAGQSPQAEEGYIDAIVQQYRNFGKYSAKFQALLKGV